MTEPNARRSPRAFIAAGVAVLLAGVIAAVLIAGGSDHPKSKGLTTQATADVIQPTVSTGPDQADVTVPGRGRDIVVHRSFFGLSTEYWTLPVDEHHTSLYKRVLTLLHVPGDDRLILRIGGDSSDHAVFDPTARRLPPGRSPSLPHSWRARRRSFAS